MHTMQETSIWVRRCQKPAETQHGEVLHTEMSNDLHIIAPCVVSIRSDWDVIAARMAARDAARRMGFSTIDQARIATVTSELSRNIMMQAGEGNVTISQIQRGDVFGIEIVFQDEGPGTSSENAVPPGNGAAIETDEIGLSGSRHLMDELDIHTEMEHRTIITCRKWLR